MSCIMAKNLYDVKIAMETNKSIICVEGRSNVDESVLFFKKIRLAKYAGNIGIVAGFFVWPLFIGGLGEKILTHKYKKYTYSVSEDFETCIVININEFRKALAVLPSELKETMKKLNLNENTISDAKDLNVRDIKKALNYKNQDYINNAKCLKIIDTVYDYIEEYAGEQEYSASEYFKYLNRTITNNHFRI